MEKTIAISKIDDVLGFAATLNAELDRCDHNEDEGTECISLDSSLKNYASHCYQLSAQIRHWANDIFSGRAQFDSSVEEAWQRAGKAMRDRATEMLERARQEEVDCFELPGINELGTAILLLKHILDGWVSPRLAVGPWARQTDSLAPQLAAAQKTIAELTPLPADWMPINPGQLSVYRKTGKS